jgi:malate dehydrogenase (oxaloacetate-decarboxylating)
MVACDRGGVLHRGRQDIEDRRAEFPDKWLACQESNGDGITGGIREALIGADVCIAFAHPGPGVIQPEWLTGMRSDAIVFARANPVPEIWPEDAKAAGARIVATGRSHLPNQLDNPLRFPSIFRGVLDIAAVHELARYAATRRLDDEDILLTMTEWEVFPRVAVATARAAQTLGITQVRMDDDELYQRAYRAIRNARERPTR